MKYYSKDIVKYLVGETGMSKRAAEKAADLMFGFIFDAMANGDAVLVRDFGRFDSKYRKEREIHMLNGGMRRMPGQYIPKFYPGKALKDAVNKIETEEKE